MNKLSFFCLLLIVFSGCIFPPEEDTEDPVLQRIREIEASLYIGDAEYLFQYKDGSNDIKAKGGYFIWFNTIEGKNSHTKTVFHSDFDSKVLGKNITGFLEAQWSYKNNKGYLKIDAKRISQNSSSKETYEMITDFIPKVSQDTDDVTDLIVVKYELSGFSACDTKIKSTSYIFDSQIQTKTMTRYNCTNDSKITITMYLSK